MSEVPRVVSDDLPVSRGDKFKFKFPTSFIGRWHHWYKMRIATLYHNPWQPPRKRVYPYLRGSFVFMVAVYGYIITREQPKVDKPKSTSGVNPNLPRHFNYFPEEIDVVYPEVRRLQALEKQRLVDHLVAMKATNTK